MTVPIVRKSKPSRRRAALVAEKVINLVEPPEFHGNPINGEGALVTIDWGFDMLWDTCNITQNCHSSWSKLTTSI